MDYKGFLRKYVKPATGCTEPIAVSYASALAYHTLCKKMNRELPYNEITSITVETDINVYKNAASVCIPGTEGMKGLAFAASLGLFCDPKKELNLLEDIETSTAAAAKSLLQKVKVITTTSDELEIKVTLVYATGQSAESALVELQQEHDQIIRIQVNDEILYSSSATRPKEGEFPATIADLVELAKQLPADCEEILLKGISMNQQVAEQGLRQKYGMGIGRHLQKLMADGTIEKSELSVIKMMVAAAGDARMGGIHLPVMTTSGSGNQGLLALIPLGILGKDKRITAEAAMLAHLVTQFSARISGNLSAICGCGIKAGFGATAGITYLLGGNEEEINRAINLLAANITGMICDGAKESCALKLLTATGAAVESAYMAMNGISVKADNGIVYPKAEQTLHAIGRISYSMDKANLQIVDIIKEK